METQLGNLRFLVKTHMPIIATKAIDEASIKFGCPGVSLRMTATTSGDIIQRLNNIQLLPECIGILFVLNFDVELYITDISPLALHEIFQPIHL